MISCNLTFFKAAECLLVLGEFGGGAELCVYVRPISTYVRKSPFLKLTVVHLARTVMILLTHKHNQTINCLKAV